MSSQISVVDAPHGSVMRDWLEEMLGPTETPDIEGEEEGDRRLREMADRRLDIAKGAVTVSLSARMALAQQVVELIETDLISRTTHETLSGSTSLLGKVTTLLDVISAEKAIEKSTMSRLKRAMAILVPALVEHNKDWGYLVAGKVLGNESVGVPMAIRDATEYTAGRPKMKLTLSEATILADAIQKDQAALVPLPATIEKQTRERVIEGMSFKRSHSPDMETVRFTADVPFEGAGLVEKLLSGHFLIEDGDWIPVGD